MQYLWYLLFLNLKIIWFKQASPGCLIVKEWLNVSLTVYMSLPITDKEQLSYSFEKSWYLAFLSSKKPMVNQFYSEDVKKYREM